MENNIYLNVLRDIASAIRKKRRIYTSTSTRGNIKIKVKDFAAQILAISRAGRLVKDGRDNSLMIRVLAVTSYTASADATDQTNEDLMNTLIDIQDAAAAKASIVYVPLEAVADCILNEIPGNSTYTKQGDTLIFTPQ